MYGCKGAGSLGEEEERKGRERGKTDKSVKAEKKCRFFSGEGIAGSK